MQLLKGLFCIFRVLKQIPGHQGVVPLQRLPKCPLLLTRAPAALLAKAPLALCLFDLFGLGCLLFVFVCVFVGLLVLASFGLAWFGCLLVCLFASL